MSTINLWSKVLEELKITASKPIFQTLLSQTDLISLEKDVATISCPNPYIQNMVETRYYSLLKAALDNQTKTNNSIVFNVKARVAPKTATGPLFEVINKKETPFKKETGLNPKYTFSTLVVGSSNNFAHAAAKAIVQNPGNAYNPFFIWGGVGVGKTHLMQAIGHALLEKFPNFKILYCPSETFTNELVNALQTKTIAEFKKKYRQPDVLLVDDIQFISGKEYNQEEFFHTFNSLYLSGKQIVLTADRRPDEISKVEERLTSRFMGGLTVDIQPPDYEMRVAILQAKCQEKNINPDQQALTFLAQMTNSNTRELEGTLMQVITQAQTQNSPIDLEFVKKFFGVKSKIHHKTISPNIVLSVVAKHFKTKPSDLLGSCRRQELVLPRQVAMYLLREEIEVPLMKIGEILGGRDHTTIMHGVKKISLRFNVDSSLRHEIMLIKQTLYG
ncbi:MAG: chromosomal replication initiator protein DnaA [bacterium]|nr:chromosomal replication initiator protein DnaA [bacterium]